MWLLRIKFFYSANQSAHFGLIVGTILFKSSIVHDIPGHLCAINQKKDVQAPY